MQLCGSCTAFFQEGNKTVVHRANGMVFGFVAPGAAIYIGFKHNFKRLLYLCRISYLQNGQALAGIRIERWRDLCGCGGLFRCCCHDLNGIEGKQKGGREVATTRSCKRQIAGSLP